jgi:hypothetical protein
MATTSLPVLEIDLMGPDGNIFMVLGMVKRTLEANHEPAEATEKYAAIKKWMDDGNGNGEYLQLLAYIHATHCEIDDLSGEHDFYDPLFDPTSD